VPFFKVGKESAFTPGRIHTVTLLGRKIGIVRDPDGTLRAMEVTCRHQNADLTQGRRDGDVVTCPRHGWQYDLRTGDCLTEPWARLRRFDLQVVDGEVLVSPAPREDAGG
jgi:phenylpropionate dioxygenase-like ring-hydroxylating dioxygenase large terminal subunit